eukprot:747788-Hanusia_phi.AAC.3
MSRDVSQQDRELPAMVFRSSRRRMHLHGARTDRWEIAQPPASIQLPCKPNLPTPHFQNHVSNFCVALKSLMETDFRQT